MKSNPFQVGDLVKLKHSLREAGEVVEIDGDTLPIKVKWPLSKCTPSTWASWHDPEDLEFAESPIERMKRLYDEIQSR